MWQRLKGRLSALARARWAAARAGAREQRFGLLLVGLAFSAFCLIYAAFDGAHHGEGDGHYTWLYARSIVYDHDLNFRNDYQVCGDFWGLSALDRGGLGRPDNSFYIGPSLFWVPLLYLARKVVHIPADAPLRVQLGCVEPLSTFVLAIGPVLGALVLWFGYRVARRYADDGPAAAATALVGLVGTLPHYAASQPHYSHIYSAFGLGLTVLLTFRAWEQPLRLLRWAAVGLGVAVTTLVRTSDAVVVLLPAAAAVAAFAPLWKQPARRAQLWRLAPVLAFIGLGVVLGAIPNLMVFKYLYGKYLVVSQGRYYMNFGQAQPWLVLFAPHGGLFYTTPSAWLSVAGAVMGLRKRHTATSTGRHPLWPLTAGLVAVALLSVYVYGAVHDWGGSYAFGSRRLTGLTTLLVPLAAIATARISAWLAARPRFAHLALALLLTAVPSLVWITAVSAARQGEMKLSYRVPQADFYGGSARSFWRLLDDSVGGVPVLPGALYTWARYQVPPSSYGKLTEGSWYARNMHTLAWFSRTLPINTMGRFGRNIEQVPLGLKLTGRRSTLVFSAVWPYATHLTLRVRAARPTQMQVGRGRLVWTRYYASAPLVLKAGDNSFDLPVPPGGFSRGINELVFQIDDPGADLLLLEVSYDDRTTYIPALQP